jgi:hypothetical protein
VLKNIHDEVRKATRVSFNTLKHNMNAQITAGRTGNHSPQPKRNFRKKEKSNIMILINV